MFIKNHSQLINKSLNETHLFLRKLGLSCIEVALNAVKPKNLIENSVKIENNKLMIKSDSFNLNKFKKIFIIGGGKCTAEMAISLENILLDIPDINYEGIINIPEGLEVKESETTKIRINFATHPIPNKKGLFGTKKMMELISQSSKEDLIICLISGGGSALLPLPKKGITIKDLQKINSYLLASGASIHEINTIRKHLSDFKGGNLAKKVAELSGASLISLIISDVVGDNLDSIASGPTVPDLSTYEDVIEILKKYVLYEKIPTNVKEILSKGLKNKELETPKPNDNCFNNVHNYLIGSVNSAVQFIMKTLKKHSFETDYFSKEIIGEAQEFGKKLYRIISHKMEEYPNSKNKIALIGTGELTVTIKGTGIGGRNQEMLLSFLNYSKDEKFDYNLLIIGVNLDGIEGNSKAMGALVDNYILTRINETSINTQEYLNNNNSNSFFKNLEGEIITGPTGCNVNDLLLILIQK